MQSEAELIDFIRNGREVYFSHITIDCVIFGYHDQQLKVLLARYPWINGWGLPGGFIKLEETLSQASVRILKERTSLDDIFLQQFHTFGDDEERLVHWHQKYFPGDFKETFGADNWLLKRTITIGYYALVEFSKVELTPDLFHDEFEWHNATDLPDLLFDHNEIIEKALATMRIQLYHQPIGYKLLADKFTLPEIHMLYETILNKKLDRRNFPNKLMSLGILVKLQEKRKIGQHRAPFLYEFNKEKYEEALKKDVVIVF
jgi:8-oxo-dGTP diphosphatase